MTVERTATRPEALRAHVEANDLGSVVHEHYEVWQQQTSKLVAIAESEFGDRGIDLVVDDASHLLEPTRACFNVLFPRVRPGGWYLLEDWAWAHWPGPYQQGDWLERQPLSELILELVLVAASHRDVVASMQLEYGLVAVQRGPASLGPDFDVSASYRARGKRVGWI